MRPGSTKTALLGALVLAGCGSPPNSLSGSLDEVAPLQFQGTVVRASPEVLAVEYDSAPPPSDGGSAAGTDVVFKMVVDISGLTLNQGLVIDLSEHFLDGRPRATASRSVGSDPRRDLPAFKRGELVLDSNINVGQTGAGHFHALFAEGGQIGEGRTVEGSFSANVDDANPGAQP